MVAEAHSYGLNSVGRVKSWSGGHAFNAAVVSVGDGDLELVFFEPQDQTKDKIVTEEEILGDENSKYSLENALVIIA